MIRKIMPRCVSDLHARMMNDFFNSGYSKVLNVPLDMYALDSQKKCFSVMLISKMFMDQEYLTLISYLKRKNEYSYVILNEWGELDCFGEHFFNMTNLNFDFSFIHQNIPIFYFLPQLIPFFLPYFYNIPNFNIENFELNTF